MQLLPTTRLRSTATVAAASGLLLAGLTAAPGAGAEAATAGGPSGDKAPYTTCYVDGQSFGEGTPVGSGPLKWQYSGTPWAGARYDRCKNTVTLYYGGYKAPAWYQVRWSLSPQQTLDTYNTQGAGARHKTMVASHADNTTSYTLQVRACSGTLCTRWSPLIILSYYP
ncbi:hypothetical protein SY2F82_65170 [Streptomyces sp. Y2F8-2]|nr:hypothetical protein SY2F82_65170 [Streptomyces sp. Y2F8-2]